MNAFFRPGALFCASLLLISPACSKQTPPSESAAAVPADAAAPSDKAVPASPANAAPALPPASAPKPSDIGRPTVSIGHTQQIAGARLSPDGKKLFTMDNSNMRVWDVGSGKEIKLALSYDGGNNPWEARWEVAFVESKKWMLIPRPGRVVVINYETLEQLPGWSGWSPRAVAWDDHRDKGYIVDVHEKSGTYTVSEIVVEAGKWKTLKKSTVKMVTPQHTVPHCRRVLMIEGDRLLADTTSGYFIVDLKTWLVSRFDAEPERSASVDRPHASFGIVPPDKEYELGPEGTLLSKPVYYEKTRTSVSIEVLSPKDLSVIRTGAFEANYASFTDLTDFDPKSRTLWLRGFKQLYALDFDTLRLRETIELKELMNDGSIAGDFLQNASRLSEPGEWLLTGQKTTWKYNAATGKPFATFGDRIATISRLVTGPEGFEFLVTDGSKKAKRVRVLQNGLSVSTVQCRYDSIAYDPSGEMLARGSSAYGKADISDTSNWAKTDFRLPADGSYNNASAANLVFSDDGTVLVIHSGAGVAAGSLENGRELLNEKLSNKWIHDDPDLVAISPDNRWLVAYDGDKKIIGFDLTAPEGRRRVWTQALNEFASLFSFVGPDTFVCLRNGRLEYRAAESGAVLAAHNLSGSIGIGRSSALSRDRKLAAVCSSDITVYDTETGKVVWDQDLATNVTSVAFFANPRYLVTVTADNLIRLWDLQEKRELCTLALFADNDEWVVSTGDLRFDASENAIDKMYVVKDTSIIPLDSLFDQLYTPKLLVSLLAGEELAPPAVDLQKLRLPPSVKLSLADGTRNLVVEDDTNGTELDRDTVRLRAIAEARESSIGELRLFQNGKLVTTTAGNGAQFTHSFDAKLTPGENVFRVIAVNEQRTESRPAEVIITYRPNAGPLPVAGMSGGGLQLHLLVVGVNTYKNSKYNLNYAVADATAVKEKLEAQTRSIFTAINVTFILNEKADKASLTDAFKSISTKAGPRDVFIFYYAGHGVMTSDAKPEFFLVPHDVTQLYGADDALRQKGLSSAELMELSKVIPAQKQLFILDACQAAGALTSVAMRGAAEEKAIAQLARSTGTHWLTASGSEQFATEFAQLGHGAFTYALIEGLSGKADTGDGRVTVNELKAWLESQVPELTQKHKGTPQYPSSYGFGQDFPVAVISK